jgi:predicted O-methyltransferase YrrM
LQSVVALVPQDHEMTIGVAELPQKLIGRAYRALTKYPDRSWFWPILDEYRDSSGRTLHEVELANSFEFFNSESLRREAVANKRWTWSPKTEVGVDQLIALLEAFFDPDESFTYLEFGTCFGTTFTRVLGHFQNARGIGLEVNRGRAEVTRWLVGRMDPLWHLRERVELYHTSILELPLQPDSVNAVLMDTNHVYPDEFEFIMHLLGKRILRRGFVFVIDDPAHTGTDTTRKRFIAEHGDHYKNITRIDKNLWWFFAR